MNEDIRREFPIFEDGSFVYLDSAATTQKPKQVIDRLNHFYLKEYATVHRSIYKQSRLAEKAFYQVREKVAAFLKVDDPEAVIFTRGTTESINLVASTIFEILPKERKKVVITAMEHHANMVPWQQAAKRNNLLIEVVPLLEDGSLNIMKAKEMLQEDVALFACTHISNVLGTINPIEELCKHCRSKGIITLIDGAQSVPHSALDLREIDPDFFVFSSHKMYGPTGVGVLWGRKALLEKMPPYQTGGSMIETVTFDTSSFLPPPLRFEAGTPSIGEVIAFGEALEFLSSIGKEKIDQIETALLVYAEDRLSRISELTILSSGKGKKAPISSFIIEGVHPLDLASLLDIKGVAIRSGHMCAEPLLQSLGYSSVARMSLGIYNSERDVDLFLKALEYAITALRS